MSEGGDVLCGGEEACVPGNSAQDARVLILYFALHDAMAESLVVDRGGDGGVQFACGIEGGMRHAKGAEHFALAEVVQRFVGEAFEGNSENDETDIAVLGMGAGLVRKRCGEGCFE